MDKEINNNGFEYVDLDLPSGTLWATKNVGAHKPSDFGLYFQWGDTIGYTDSQVGYECGQTEFNWANYKWNPSGDGETFAKYTTTGATLELEDDAAHVNMGGDWHMPTPKQCQELIDNTTRVWSILDGVGGMKFTSKNDESRFIFIPVAGMAWDGLVDTNEYNGNVWTSMVSTTDIDGAQSLFFDFGCCCLGNGGRRSYGFSVRGVIDKKFDKPKGHKSNMNKDLDLTEILKDVPKGLELWSYACGTCYFKGIVKYSDYPIECKTQTKDGGIQTLCFTKEGKRDTIFPNGQCVLFPSKDNQDWATFKAPENHKHFEPYQKVLVKAYSENHKIWFPDIYLFFEEQNSCHKVAINKYIRNDSDIIPYKGNEDKVGKR